LACRNENFKVIQLLVEKGANVNAISFSDGKKSSTPLIEACNKGKFKIIEYLIKNGAAINDEMSILYYVSLTMDQLLS
jgi:ankyrin repeat protein